MLVFFLVQPTPLSMLLQLGFSGVFSGERIAWASGRKTRVCLPLVWLLMQFSLIDGKSCLSTHTFYALL